MKLVNHYLTQNKASGIYYVRLNIPNDLQPHYGIKTIKRSLQTKDKFIASYECLKHISKYKEEFHNIRKMSTGKFIKLITVKNNGDATFDTGDTAKDYELAKKWANLKPQTNTNDDSMQSIRLEEIIAEYCTEKHSAEKSWSDKTLQENQSIFNLLLRIIGKDIMSNQINYETARKYKNTLKNLPTHINTKPEYKTLTIQEIIKSTSKTISTNTINKHLGRTNSLMNWCFQHGYITNNYFSNINLKNNQSASKERQPLNDSDLKLIFNALDATEKKPYKYWLPILGYYTGARINELCQLYVDDIKKDEDGIFYFDINKYNEKRLKNNSSIRAIPLHHDLIELKFMKYVINLKYKGIKRMFPELPHARDGYSKNASRWFSNLKTKLGITDPKKTFHSFRHTFVENLKLAQVEDKYIKALLGHADNSETTGRYGTGQWPLKVLNDMIQKIPNYKNNK